MSYLFDASAIFIAYKRDLEDLLFKQYTINLALFELGNVIWKECYIYKSISFDEAKKLLSEISRLLEIMRIIDVNKLKEDILSLAVNLGITYYDALYVYIAKKQKLILVTEDKKLKNKAMQITRVKNLDELQEIS